MTFLGLIYGWSIFVIPLESEFAWTRADTSLVFTISMITFCSGGIVGGILNRRFNEKMILFIIALCEFVGFFMSSEVTQLYEIYISYGVICGFSTGIAYNTVVSMVTSWFPNNLGMASGILMMGYGLGAFVLGSVATFIINSIGWRFAFKLLAFSFAIVIILGALFIKVCKFNEKNEKQFSNKMIKSYTTVEMITTPIFWKIYVWASMISAIGMTIISNVSPCSMEFGATATVSIMAVGSVSISNGVGRIVFGILYDKVGKSKTIIIISLCAICGSIFLVLGVKTTNLYVLIAGFIVVSLSYSGLAPTSPVFAKSIFGEKYYSTNFSVLASSGIPASVIGSYFIGIILTKTNSYLICFCISIVIAAVALVICLNTARKVKEY